MRYADRFQICRLAWYLAPGEQSRRRGNTCPTSGLSPVTALYRARRPGGGIIEPDHHGRYIVGRTTVERQADQKIAGALWRVAVRNRHNLPVFNVIGEPVAANHENVAAFQCAVGHFK